MSQLVAAAPHLQAQDRQLTGIVLDAGTQRPLPGVEVRVLETQGTTTTEANGRFVLRGLPDRAVTLELRRLGYRRLQHRVETSAASIRILLSETAIELDELVVTGTPAATEKRAIGNAVSRFSGRDVVESTSVNEMQQLLNGRVPGLVQMPSAGNVGTGGLTRIRGIGSMSLPNRPVVYVDGVRVDNSERVGPSLRNGRQTSRINDINPEDIETVEVIKGPGRCHPLRNGSIPRRDSDHHEKRQGRSSSLRRRYPAGQHLVHERGRTH